MGATFSRASVAYKQDGAQVAANLPRFEAGKFDQAVHVEEGTTNLISPPKKATWGMPARPTIEWTQAANFKISGVSATGGTLAWTIHPTGLASSDISAVTISLKNPINTPRWVIQLIDVNGQAITSGWSAPGWTYNTWYVGWLNTGMAGITELTCIGFPAGVRGIGFGVRDNTPDGGLLCSCEHLQIEDKRYRTSFIDGTRVPETLTVPTAGVLNPQEGTMEQYARLLRSPGTNEQFIFDGAGAAANQNLQVLIATNGRPTLRYGTGAATVEIQGATAWVKDTWYAIAWKWEAAGVKLLVNGAVVASSATAPSLAFGANAFLGSRADNALHLGGLIDDLRISSRARSDAEILSGYNSNAPLPVDASTTYKLTLNGSIFPVETCWIPLGTFWSGDWHAPENEIYASTTGRDRLELLRKSSYTSSQVAQNTTLYALALAVLQDAGLTAAEYWVDTALQSYTIPYAYFETQSHREALRKIAEACLGQGYCDRDGVIRVEGPAFLASKVTSDLALTSDDYFRKDNPMKWSQIANYVEVETAPLKPDVPQEVYRSNETVPIAVGEIKTLTVHYNNPPCIEAVASLSGQPVNCTITAATYYAWGASITVSSPTNAGSFTLIVSARPLKVLNRERAVAQDAASITDNGKLKFTFPSNPLVQTLSMAQTIANNLLASYKDPRRDIEMEWRGNPALLLADRVTVTDKNEQNDYFVTRQEIEWTGALRTKMSGRRVS